MGRHQRPVHRPLAQGHQGQGRGPHPVCPCRSTWSRRSWSFWVEPPMMWCHPIADRGPEPCPCLGQRPGADQARHDIFEMMGHRSIYHDGGGGSVAGAVVQRSRKAVRRAHPRRHPDQPRCVSLGSFITWPRTSPRTTTWPRKNKAKLIEMVAQWYVEAGKYKSACGRPRHAARPGGAPPASPSTAPATRSTRTRSRYPRRSTC